MGDCKEIMTQHQQIDINSYIERITSGRCFICEMQVGNPDYRHHIIYEDETAVVFLNKYPILYGYTFVAPRKHCEQVTGDFTREEYLSLQDLIYRVSEAVSQVVPTERIYILSLGSQQGNSHVHWHIAPLPPGVPIEEQQYEALRLEKGVLSLSEAEMAALAVRIGQRMADKA